MDTAKRRPRIGFQLTQISLEYCAMYMQEIMHACRDAGADLVVFEGGSLLAPHTFDYQQNAIYGYMKGESVDALIILTATMKNFVDGERFAKLVDSFGSIPLISISAPLYGHASLVIDNRAGLEAAIRHLVTDHGRRRVAFIGGPAYNPEACERYDAYRDTLALLGIPLDPAIVVNGDFTARSGARAVDCLIDERKANFDAIVAGNDVMAIAAIQALQERGIGVPADIAVAGFDDLTQASYSSPTLTTVRQPFRDQARAAVRIACEAIAGTPSDELITFPTELVTRTSCGCFPRSITIHRAASHVVSESLAAPASPSVTRFIGLVSALEAPAGLTAEEVGEYATLLFDLFTRRLSGKQDERAFMIALHSFATRRSHTIEQLFFWEEVVLAVTSYLSRGDDSGALVEMRETARIILRESLMTLQNRKQFRLLEESTRFQGIMQLLLLTRDLSDLVSVIPQIVNTLDVRTFILVLHKPFKPRADALPLSGIEGREVLVSIVDGAVIEPAVRKPEGNELLPNALVAGMRDYRLIAATLFSREELFGYVCFEPGSHSPGLYHSMIMELGSVIKRCVLGTQQKHTENKLRNALQRLRETNQRLADQSQRDELTKLYNRRGFLDLATHSLMFAQRMEKTGMMLFVDLDGLKPINDTWGHAAGDLAIKGAALVLKATFRQIDIIARLGGDEFVVLALDSPYANKDIILDRLTNNIETFNSSGAHKWVLAMSVGVLEIASDDKRPLPELMEEADRLQYEEKMRKRKARGQS